MSTEKHSDERAEAPDDVDRIICEDSFDALDELPPESVHAIVTDPPYGLGFMGTSWDEFEPREYQDWCEKWARRAKRVLKPGGHLLAFSGTRTFHRLLVGVEDAGLTFRDTVMWIHGQGFPKGQDIGDSIRRYGDEADAERAEKWDGWSSQIKPAFEPVGVFQKPLSESSIYRNVLEYGTGALNIDDCRIPIDGELTYRTTSYREAQSGEFSGQGETNYTTGNKTVEGRYPANVVLDDEAAVQLDDQSGVSGSSGGQTVRGYGSAKKYGNGGDVRTDEDPGYGDTGGASRFFYCAKASKSERTNDGAIENDHPTVKPLDLCEWLVRLVSAEEQVVLDPFAGSGTIPLAAANQNRRYIGIEREEQWVDVARERLADRQTGLDDYSSG